MDKIEKLLSRLTSKEREDVRFLLASLARKEYKGIDVKKLKGRDNIFRVRKGALRIIYRVVVDAVFLLAIERRNEKTYKL